MSLALNTDGAASTPGCVDLQVNGFVGVDFSSPSLTQAEIHIACREYLSRGITAFLPTLVTSPLATYARNLPLLAQTIDQEQYKGRLPGIHLEGPFISPLPGYVGAHNAEFVRPVDIEILRKLMGWAGGKVRLLTLAAELPGAAELTRFAVSQGIAVSIGHSCFTSADLDRLVEAGATALTHLGNGIPNLLPRHDNPIWAGLATDSLTAMIIADGHHLPAPLLKTILRVKGAAKVILVSDASPIAGLPPGRYTTLGNEAVLEESGRLWNPIKNCLVGSSRTLPQCIAHLSSLGFVTKQELVKMGYTNPLRMMT